MPRRGAANKSATSGGTSNGGTDGSSPAGSSTGAVANGGMVHAYSHSGMPRGRPLLEQSTYLQSASFGGHYSSEHMPVLRSAMSLRSISSMASMRHEQESVGILESCPSSPSSASGASMMAKTPTFEYYGFVVYLVSLVAFTVYLLWAYLPDEVLRAAGITYYPDRYWALAMPAWWVSAMAFLFVFNMATNMYNTPLINSIDNITDPQSLLPSEMNCADRYFCAEVGGIPPIGDLPISLVNKCLYQ
ncbi:hypothetical protein GGI04_004050 [Coemansia thaxteri]|uniref:PIG-P domain-containing protein n=1 Tax=Coemansia thaxteri TaxID=2663907 RepID=A0A9W8EGY7_9FUNG|nr:hypothetical protein H4R26_005642 [Coemansia thaxteri]KAJ2000687.1 hypothetical protein GGI04_004050 [Coemansia thaxteri]KAJ2472569.1 hypothetical protein GGI02_001493 [Coemansia sp. RSA 2322]KAJ2481085.1 hypothetical protein EV174_003566 [Coemansia sp. RSA 2320]